MHKTVGDSFAMSLFGRELFFTSNTELINQVFTEPLNFPARPINGGAFLNPCNLITLPSNEMWQIHRSKLSALFTDSYLQIFVSSMKEVTQRLITQYESNGRRPHVFQDMADLTLDILGKTVMGHDFQSLEATPEQRQQKEDAGRTTLQFFASLGGLPRWMWSWFPVPGRKQAYMYHEQKMAQLRGLLAKAREDKKPPTTMLAFMAHQTTWSEQEILDEVGAFILAGHETTANTLTFALHLLSQNPEVQQRCRDEIRSTLLGGDIQYEHIAQLVYVRAVFYEALRLYPTVPLISREAARPTFLGGYYIRPGTMIVTCQLALGRDPTLFTDALSIRRERWLEGGSEPFTVVRNFGGGRRQCIGKRFAEEESILILCGILGAFKVWPEAESETIIETIFQVTQTLKKPLALRFEKC